MQASQLKLILIAAFLLLFIQYLIASVIPSSFSVAMDKTEHKPSAAHEPSRSHHEHQHASTGQDVWLESGIVKVSCSIDQ